MVIKITVSYLGDDTGPYNIYTDIDGFTIPVNPIPLLRGDLIPGPYLISVSDNATIIRLKSENVSPLGKSDTLYMLN